MANVVLTNEQFAELMSRISLAGNTTQGVTTGGNFSKCLSRFDGSKDSDVNAFIDAVCIYEDCARVSDANALKGLPMLFDGFAAKWYQGVKTTVQTFDDALALLTTFGPQKPPYRVYRELFATEQDLNTPIDIFICKLRSILAQLPSGTLTEEVQLDMIYGLLNRRIREKVPRDKVKTFSELLANSRLIEETFDRIDNVVTKDIKDTQRRIRCQYCKNIGHTYGTAELLRTTENLKHLPVSRIIPVTRTPLDLVHPILHQVVLLGVIPVLHYRAMDAV
nr:uncharacterized protein LOC111508140 [Leptinotarsa decemlineata]